MTKNTLTSDVVNAAIVRTAGGDWKAFFKSTVSVIGDDSHRYINNVTSILGKSNEEFDSFIRSFLKQIKSK